MTNLLLLILGLAVSICGSKTAPSVTGRYVVTFAKVFNVGRDNRVSVFIASNVQQPANIKFELLCYGKKVETQVTCKPGDTCSAILALPKEFPVGIAQVSIIGSGGIQFEEKRDALIYDQNYNLFVQTSSSSYRPGETMEIRVVVTDDKLIPVRDGSVLVEVYDAELHLVGSIRDVPIRDGLSDLIRFPLARHSNFGTWLVSSTIKNTTMSVQVLVSRPISPSFDLAALFPRVIQPTETTLRGTIELADEMAKPIFGRCILAINAVTEEELKRFDEAERKENEKPSRQRGQQRTVDPQEESRRTWKNISMEVAGVHEINIDLKNTFGVDTSKCLALNIYVKCTALRSGQQRTVERMIPVFEKDNDINHDIQPLSFEAGRPNTFAVTAKQWGGKPVPVKDMEVDVKMMIKEKGGKTTEKELKINELYTNGRTDMVKFTFEVPESCQAMLIRLTPKGKDGKPSGLRTRYVEIARKPLAQNGAHITIELNAASTQGGDLVSTQVPVVGKPSEFTVELTPSESIRETIQSEQSLELTYVVMTNGLMSCNGHFTLRPSKECNSKAPRAILQEDPSKRPAPVCLFNGTFKLDIKREMVPYSTLVVYAFNPTFGMSAVQAYRFAVNGLLNHNLTLNATSRTFTPNGEQRTDLDDDSSEEDTPRRVSVSSKAQALNRVELTLKGQPNSLAFVNVAEIDSLINSIPNALSMENLLTFFTRNEQLPIQGLPVMKPIGSKDQPSVAPRSFEESAEELESRSVEIGDEQAENAHAERFEEGYMSVLKVQEVFFDMTPARPPTPIDGVDPYLAWSSNTANECEKKNTLYNILTTPSRHSKMCTVSEYTLDKGIYEVPLVMTESSVEDEREKEDREDREGIYDETEEDRWYTKVDPATTSVSHEAFILMNVGLNVVSDFASLAVPEELVRATNLTEMINNFPSVSSDAYSRLSYNLRDYAREMLQEYMLASNFSFTMPEHMYEAASLWTYSRSLLFNDTRLDSTGSLNITLPHIKPYSTWTASAFALNAEKGLSVAKPVRVPREEGVFVMVDMPSNMVVGERGLITIGVNNFFNDGKDLNNVVLRIQGSNEYELTDVTSGQVVSSGEGKDFTLTIPSIKGFGSFISNVTIVPKRCGVLMIVVEIESEHGGDFDIKTIAVRESGFRHMLYSNATLFDLTGEQTRIDNIKQEIKSLPELRQVSILVSGTGLSDLVHYHTRDVKSLIGIDRAIVDIWRPLAFRCYLNETARTESLLFNATTANITRAVQKLQLYSDYNGSYAFTSDEGFQLSSLYLTSMAFGAMISPLMPVRDNVTLNRTLNYILSRQQQDGSFDDAGPCYQQRFCTGEYRKESMTALVLYMMLHSNMSTFYPDFVRARLLAHGEKSPIIRAQRYLASRLDSIKDKDILVDTFVRVALLQTSQLPESDSNLIKKIEAEVQARELAVDTTDRMAKFVKAGETLPLEDRLLLNQLTVLLRARSGDFRTCFALSRWIVGKVAIHDHSDTVLDALIGTTAWATTDILFWRTIKSSGKKFDITVDIKTSNGQTFVAKINETNADVVQEFNVTVVDPSSIRDLTYSVSGYGIVGIFVQPFYVFPTAKHEHGEKKTTTDMGKIQLTSEFEYLPWITNVKAKTCVTYTPPPTTTTSNKEKEFNRTIVLQMPIPSGARVDLRLAGFFLSNTSDVMWFSYMRTINSLVVFLNVNTTSFGKPMCVEWALERISDVIEQKPVNMRAYDYLRPEVFSEIDVPFTPTPKVLGYAYLEAVESKRVQPEGGLPRST